LGKTRHLLTRAAGFVLLVLFATVLRIHAQAEDHVPEVALKLFEPWEDMRKRSSAEIHAISGEEVGSSWFRVIPFDARLRFADSHYGFVTPRAKFFTIGFNRAKVTNVRMSPQVEALVLDDALKVVIDLQDQWRNGGWKPFDTKHMPLFADTPQWRKDLEDCKTNTTFWLVPGLYQTQLDIACFDDANHPNEKRYLITLELSQPYVKETDGDFRHLKPYRPPQP
jgi:hypothetical protein